jgi:SAM-dependent methyltransferase
MGDVLRTKRLNKLVHYWLNLIQKVEGPELEPHLCHSHFLTAHYFGDALMQLGNRLCGKILDVGAGTGLGARYLVRDKTEYYPVDLLTVRDRFDKGVSCKSEKIKVYCSCYSLPFKDESINGTMLISVLEHLEDPQLALSEAFRVTIRGGCLLVATPFAFPVHGFPVDFRRWTLEGLKSELIKAGFTIISEKCIGNTFAALALNLNLLLKYHSFPSPYRVLNVVKLVAAPFLLFLQFAFNLVALLLGPLDRSKSFPLGFGILGKRMEKKE